MKKFLVSLGVALLAAGCGGEEEGEPEEEARPKAEKKAPEQTQAKESAVTAAKTPAPELKDPAIPAGTEFVTMTVREAIRDEADPHRLLANDPGAAHLLLLPGRVGNDPVARQ